MPLSAGTRLGPYDIIALVGAGGMGEVYKARDTRLHRDVAIKVLPQDMADDPDRRARFEREAQAVAALSHPNVLAIFDTGVHGGQLFAVTELLEGGTLRDELQSGPLPVKKAIGIAIQIARGLSAAHEKGLLHRDIKPENVFILTDGHVKILDFGLARTIATGSGNTATVIAMTDPGGVVGTVSYMAPEQIRAQPLDARTDLFSLGAVLYEMLAGRRAFHRGTPAETMTAILREDPPELPAVRTGLSPALDRIVRHCLEKNPAERFQSARDVAFALESQSVSGTVASEAVATMAGRRARVRPVVWVASVVLALALGVLAGRTRTSEPSLPRFETKTFDRQIIFNARFMPDGQTIVYSAAREDTVPQLFVLHPDNVTPQVIGGPGTHLLSVSARGELAVLTGSAGIAHRLFRGTLATMSPGGSPRPLREGVREADWSPDGLTLAIIRELGGGRDSLEFPVGTTLYEATGYLSDPRVSRDGGRVAFVEHPFPFDDRGRVKVVDASKQVTTLTGDLWGVEGVAWSADGTQVAFSGSEATRPGGVSYEPHIVPASGRGSARLSMTTMTDVTVQDIGRDGRWLLTREDGRYGIVVKTPDDTAQRDLSWLDRSTWGVLSVDGSELAFSDQNSSAGTNYAVMLRRTDGSPAVRLGEGNVQAPHGLSPDRKWVAAVVPSTDRFVFYPTGPGEPRRLDVKASHFTLAGWFSDSQHVLLCGGATRPSRCARYATSGGPPAPIGPEAVLYATVGSDDWVMVTDGDGKGWLYPPDGGARIPMTVPDGEVIAPGTGATWFLARPGSDRTIRLDRADLRRGTRAPVATVALPEGTGLADIIITSVVGENGRYGYVYCYTRQLSTLVVASGVITR
jgi:serine/threonine protein kinase